jgi:hypothetical protein
MKFITPLISLLLLALVGLASAADGDQLDLPLLDEPTNYADALLPIRPSNSEQPSATCSAAKTCGRCVVPPPSRPPFSPQCGRQRGPDRLWSLSL